MEARLRKPEREIYENNNWLMMNIGVRGNSHKNNSRPCQDYSMVYHKNGPAYPVVVSVADGHGDHRHFRSHVGSELACDVSWKVMRSFASQLIDVKELNGKSWGGKIAWQIKKEWDEAVLTHWNSHPLGYYPWDSSPSDLRVSSDSNQDIDRKTILEMYGTTLLTALLGDGYLSIMQIGDGEILLFDSDGDPLLLFPRKAEIVKTGETESLCQATASSRFRSTAIVGRGRDQPTMVMLSTDGLSDSFDKDQFLDVGREIFSRTLEEVNKGRGWGGGYQKVSNRLRKILLDVSKGGVGDDISVGIMINKEALNAGGKA